MQPTMSGFGAPLTSPISPDLYPTLATWLMGSGAVTAGVFFFYEAARTKFTRALAAELLLALVSSILLGFGAFFMLLWTGVYV